MTQRIFDVENEKDMQDLWDILPDEVIKIRNISKENKDALCSYDTKEHEYCYITKILRINWHGKTEITRPITEATTNDLGKLCVFWNEDNVESYGILTSIRTHVTNDTITYVKNGYNEFEHCRRLIKQEIKELC